MDTTLEQAPRRARGRRSGRGAFPGRVVQIIALLTLLVALIGALPAMRTEAATPNVADRRLAAAIESDFQAVANQHQLNGAVLVARRGVVLVDQGYGMADWSRQTPNSAHTEFRISALTGQFTAAAILRLAAQGKLRLQDSVCRYLATCPPGWMPITIQELLNGSSGLHDYLNDPATANLLGTPISQSQLLALIARYPLDTRPGSACGAYTASYPVLGYVVSRVAGRPYATYIRQAFLLPLGLRDIGFEDGPVRPAGAAIGYDSWQLPSIEDADLSFVAAAADMYSTVDDLYRWEQALAAGAVLPLSLVAAMTRPSCAYCQATGTCGGKQPAGEGDRVPIGIVPAWAALDDAPGPSGAGYPWDIGRAAGRRYWDLTATLPGFVSFERIYPDQQVTVIILSNQIDTPLYLLDFELANRLFGQRSQL